MAILSTILEALNNHNCDYQVDNWNGATVIEFDLGQIGFRAFLDSEGNGDNVLLVQGGIDICPRRFTNHILSFWNAVTALEEDVAYDIASWA